MSALMWILIVVAVVVVHLVVLLAVRRRRTTQLRERFGPEYDRAVEQEGRRTGEAELRERVERRQGFEVRELSPDARNRYAESWRLVQERFVDHPIDSVRDAHRLVQEVMRERGYPVDDFEEQAAVISVDHPDVVENYRAAHATAEASDRGDATTEDLRQAMVRYRNLFSRLLD